MVGPDLRVERLPGLRRFITMDDAVVILPLPLPSPLAARCRAVVARAV